MSLRALLSLPLLVALTACGSSMPPSAVVPAAEATPPASFHAPDWADAVVYFVVLDRFADGDPENNVAVDPERPGHFHGGDLVGLTEQLDEIAELGVTALWITPVVKNIEGFVTGAGFPDYGYHGYWADDFYALDPRFGSEAELTELVGAAHRRGMRVLLDVVYNHAGYESRYAEEPRFQPWVRVYGECGDDDLTQCVAGLPDFRTELPEVADYLLDAHLGLAARAGLDGFRLDTVKHVGHEFWQEHRRRTRAELGADFFLLGEVWGGNPDVLDPYFVGDQLDAGFDFTFSGSVLAWLQGRGRTVAFDRYLERRHRTRQGYHLAHYLSSHDVPTLPFLLAGDWRRYRLAVALQMTSVGIPVMYYGEEVGRIGGDWPANRSDMPWGDRAVDPGGGISRDEVLRDDVARMVHVRRAHPALSRGGYAAVSSEGDLLVFLRHHAESGDAVLVAVNRSEEAAAIELQVPDPLAGRPLVDALSNRELATADDRLPLTVAPLAARIIVAASTADTKGM